MDFLSLETAAGAIMTDSGGIQEEATALGLGCYTFRRQITLTLGQMSLLTTTPLQSRA